MIAAMTSRRAFALGAAAVALSACSGVIGPPESGTVYVLQPMFARPPAGSAAVNWSLELMHPDVPGGLDNDRIALIQPGGTMDYYAGATYPERVPASIQRAVLEGFEASGRITAVSREEDALHADYNLLIAVKNFEAHYAVADGIPTVQVTLMAKLTTGRGRKIVASKLFAQTGTASVNSTAAVVQALSQALGAAVTAIVDWTLAAAPPVEAAGTGSPNKPAEELLHESTRATRAKPPRP
jgi:cholesterol transport system auxiliary component